MKSYTSLILAGFLSVVQPATAQTVQPAMSLAESAQLKLGRLLPSDSVHIYIEYPEFEPLTAAERKSLSASGFVPGKDVQLHVTRGISQGETLADVRFIPVVERGGRWLRMKKYELKARMVSALSGPARVAVASALKTDAASRYADHSVLAQGKWVKISVKKEGIYQLTHESLRKMGFSDPARVKLYGYGGRLLPDKFEFNGENALIDDLNEVPLYRREGSMLFFAEGLTSWSTDGTFQNNTFASRSYYFLTEGDAPAAFSTLDAPASAGEPVDEVWARATYDNDAFVWYGGGRDFFDNNDLISGHKFKLSLPGHRGGKCKVYFDLSAQNTMGSTLFSIVQSSDGATVATGNIGKAGEGDKARGYRSSFTAELGEQETFTVTTKSTGRLNYLHTVYRQSLSTAHTTAAFTTPQSKAVVLQVSGADVNTRVWQLGDAYAPVAELPGSLEASGTYLAHAEKGNRRFVVVNTAATYDSPEVAGEIANQDLHADAAVDYVIIVPASGKLTAEAERLAEAHRNKSGLRVKVVRADQLYNEFSSGTPDAAAYRRYLKMLYDRAATPEDAPKYLLLFGDCAYDNRMITAEWRGTSPDDYLLAYERNNHESYQNSGYSIGTMQSYVTDDYYALLDDGEGGRLHAEKIDLGVGRFVCHTPEKAKWLTDRAIDYLNNKQAGIWKNRLWAIGDVGDNNLHMEDAEAVIKQINRSANSNLLLRRIYPDAYTITQEAKGGTYPEATKKLKTAMQQGAMLFNYNGHGNPDRLSKKFLLNMSDMTANVSDSRPLWLFASCEITPYDQRMDDLGRNALFAPEGPAIAVLCASRSVYANYNLALNRGFVQFAFAKDSHGKRYTLGDALRRTKCELIENTADAIGYDQTINKLKYALLGDPALTLSYPDPGITVDSVNGKPVTEQTFTELPIGSAVRFSGYVNADASASSPDASFNGTLTGTVFTPMQTITCKGYGNTRVDPLVYSDYTQTLFEGSVPVRNGRFDFEFVVPRGVTFSQSPCRLSLYAIHENREVELNGSYTQFCLNGTGDGVNTDTIGPSVYLYLNTPDFPGGAKVGPSPVFYAAISDSSGISTVSGNLGHDMELWLDDNPATASVVNDFFSFSHGSYREGLVTYPLSGLSQGRHRLTFRAWDVFGNATTSSLDFIVGTDDKSRFEVMSSVEVPVASTRLVTTLAAPVEVETTVVTEVFNVHGMRVWHKHTAVPAGGSYTSAQWDLTDYAGNRLAPGVYLYRSRKGNDETSTRRILIR